MKSAGFMRGCRVKGCERLDCGEGELAGAPQLRAARAGGRSGSGDGDLVLMELEQVVGGSDQAPFAACRGSASSSEAVEPAIELRVPEDWLDHRLPFSVEPPT